MQVTAHTVSVTTLSEPLATWQKRRARARAPARLDAALMRLRRARAPLLPLLVTRDSPAPRGRPPGAPLAMLRALLRMTLLRYQSREHVAPARRQQPRLAVSTGCAPGATPAGGAVSLCLDRLDEGPEPPAGLPRCPPAARRHGPQWRHLSKEKADPAAARQPLRAHGASLTGPLTPQPLDPAAPPSPAALQQRRADPRRQAALSPAAARGRRGARGRRMVGGDGSARAAGARAAGKPACPCRVPGVCRCPGARCSAAPTAEGGDDASHDSDDVGPPYSPPCVASGGHALPGPLTRGPASQTDVPRALPRRARGSKAGAEPPRALPRCAVGDAAGHDALGHDEGRLATQRRPGSARTPRRGGPPRPPGTAERGHAAGVPRCPAGGERRRHTPPPPRLIDHGPSQRPPPHAGKPCGQAHGAAGPRHVLGAPGAQRGPRGCVRADAAPRCSPELARARQQCRALRPRRAGGERSPATTNVVQHLGPRPCRSATPCLVRRSLRRLIDPANAWLAEDRKALRQAGRSLRDRDQLTERADRQPATGGAPPWEARARPARSPGSRARREQCACHAARQEHTSMVRPRKRSFRVAAREPWCSSRDKKPQKLARPVPSY
jgi:hypothetical protein